MNRRGFISMLGAFAASAVIDPDRLLWRPGAKLISIPKPRPAIVTRYLIDGKVCGTKEYQALFVDVLDRMYYGVYGGFTPSRDEAERDLRAIEKHGSDLIR